MPAAVAKPSVSQIDALMRASSFHKARQRRSAGSHGARLVEFEDDVPCALRGLRSSRGAGHKCANLTMGVACSSKRISVDSHVPRITNRWGCVAATRSPEETINRLLVPLRKHICTGTSSAMFDVSGAGVSRRSKQR
jgi:endonuclease-3